MLQQIVIQHIKPTRSQGYDIILLLKGFLFFSLLYICSSHLKAQESTWHQSPDSYLKNADQLFDDKIYASAIKEYERYLAYACVTSQISRAETYCVHARAKIVLCKIHMDHLEAHRDIDEFLLRYYPQEDHVVDLLLSAGNWSYSNKDYDQAISYYDYLVDFPLIEEAFTEVCFKKGYCHFVKKQFTSAKPLFSLVKDIKGSYSNSANYYLGMCQYFDQEYLAAVKSFQKVSSDRKYKSQVPYYITQIYFAQQKYTELIAYSEDVLKSNDVKKLAEIHLLVGQSYFQLNQYSEALKHLEYYELNTQLLTPKQFYQLAFTQYQLGLYKKAIDSFSELVALEDEMGQLVHYYLADCYIKIANYNSARSAFKQASTLDHNKAMQEEAAFNYAKLSAELGYDREAINTLLLVDEDSDYYRQSQKIIGDILLSTNDYQNALNILDKISPKSENLKGIEQKISLNAGVQLYNDDDIPNAYEYFNRSLNFPIHIQLELEARYWMATILSLLEKTEESIIAYDSFFNIANGATSISPESNAFMAHYNQAYNHYGLDNCTLAKRHFKNAIVGIDIAKESITNEVITDRIYYDAILRVADCEFKEGDYVEALDFYTRVSSANISFSPYAQYQKATIEGLNTQYYDQVLTLESLTALYPNSEYTDDAYYDLGNAYIQLDRSDHAFKAFEHIVNMRDSYSELTNASYLKMGLLTYNQGDAFEAIQYYKKIFDRNPSSSEITQAILALEEIYISDMGDPDAYVKFLNGLPGYELSTNEQDSLTYSIGLSRYEIAQYGDAIINLNKYIDQYPHGRYQLDAHYYRAESFLLLKKYDDAFADYEYIIEQGTSDHYSSAIRKAAVISYNHLQDFQRSYKYYDLLSNEIKDPLLSHESMIGALSSAFRINNESGVLLYAQRVRQDSLSTSEEISTASYYLGKVSYKQQNYPQAIIAFGDVIKRSSNNQAAESSYLISKIYFKQNNYDQSESQCNRTNVNSGSYPIWVAKSLMLLSDIYVVREDLYNARAALEAILENFNTNEEIVNEASSRLKLVKEMEEDKNRIKKDLSPNLLELDNSNNDE